LQIAACVLSSAIVGKLTTSATSCHHQPHIVLCLSNASTSFALQGLCSRIQHGWVAAKQQLLQHRKRYLGVQVLEPMDVVTEILLTMQEAGLQAGHAATARNDTAHTD
jgi:hypothetical protein